MHQKMWKWVAQRCTEAFLKILRGKIWRLSNTRGGGNHPFGSSRDICASSEYLCLRPLCASIFSIPARIGTGRENFSQSGFVIKPQRNEESCQTICPKHSSIWNVGQIDQFSTKIDYPKPKYRRARDDMIEVFKILHGYYNNTNKISLLHHIDVATIRGNKYKLYQSSVKLIWS